MTYDFYISYSQADKEIADSLYNGLTARGYTVFDYKQIPAGEDYSSVIAQAISKCYFFIPIVTENSIDSSFFQEELFFADHRCKSIITIIQSSLERPSWFILRFGKYRCFWIKDAQKDISYFIDRTDREYGYRIKSEKLYAKLTEFTQLGYARQADLTICEIIKLICDHFTHFTVERDTCRELLRLYSGFKLYDDGEVDSKKTANCINSTVLGVWKVIEEKAEFVTDLYFAAFAVKLTDMCREINAECADICSDGRAHVGYPTDRLRRYFEAFLDQSKDYEIYSKDCSEEDVELIKETAGMMNKLADILLNGCQDPDKAVDMRKKVCALVNTVLGGDHPETLAAKSNLAVALGKADKAEESLLLQEQVCEQMRQVYGEDNIDTLVAMSNLAHIYSKVGKHDKALELQKLCSAKFEKILGKDHPRTKAAQTELLYTYEFLGIEKKPENKERKPAAAKPRTEEDEILLSIAGFMQEGNKLFDALRQKGLAGGDFLKCLQTSYERLKKYCEVVGAKDVVSECIDRIDEIRSMIERKPDGTESNEKAENGIKSLLGFTTHGSGGYDLFISFKDEDRDMAESIYNYCHQYMKVPFWSKRSLPELSASEYENAIYDALDRSKHFVVVFSKPEYLEARWVSEEMKVFHSEIVEKRKEQGKFILIATDDVYKEIMDSNKERLNIRYRSYEIMRMSEYKEKLHKYLV